MTPGGINGGVVVPIGGNNVVGPIGLFVQLAFDGKSHVVVFKLKSSPGGHVSISGARPLPKQT